MQATVSLDVFVCVMQAKLTTVCTTSWRMTEEWLRNDNVKFNEDQVQQDNSAELERFRKVDDSRRTVPTVRVHVPGACQRMNIEHAWCILFRTNMAFSILDSWQHIHTISNYILYRCLGLSWPPPCNLVQAIRLSKGYSSLRFIFYCQSCQVLPHQNGDIFWSSLKVQSSGSLKLFYYTSVAFVWRNCGQKTTSKIKNGGLCINSRSTPLLKSRKETIAFWQLFE